MKKLFPLLLFIGLTTQSQTVDCKKMHNGRFEMSAGIPGKIVVVRTNDTQTESYDVEDSEMSYDVKWLDECTYELRNKKVVKGSDRFKGNPGDTLKVEIINVEGNRVFVRLSSNFSDKVYETDMVKVD